MPHVAMVGEKTPMQDRMRFVGTMPPPLRDLLRGAKTAADATEEILEPAWRIVPRPLRAAFRSALEAAEASGRSVLSDRLEQHEINAASRFLDGDDTSSGAASAFVRALGYGWDKCLRSDPARNRLLISETVATHAVVRFQSSKSEYPTGEKRAAQIIASLQKNRVIGRVPGTPVSSESERKPANLALVAIALWLLADRPASPTEEDRILDLSFALTHALGDDLMPKLSTAGEIAAELARLRSHI